MSIHKSLKLSSALVRSRNVFTRSERLERLKELGKWDESKDSCFHLPKVKTQIGKKIGKKKKKKEEGEAAEGTAAAPAAGAAAPAAGAAAPAKPAAAPAASAKSAPAAKK